MTMESKRAESSALAADRPERRSRRGRTSSPRWFVRVTATATLCALVTTALASNGSATVIANPAGFTPPPVTEERETPERDNPKRDNRQPPAETYAKRIDRIAGSEQSLLRPLEANENAATVCVSGEFTTLSVVYDSIFESLYPSLPPSLHAGAHAARSAAHRDMARLHVSTLAVSEHPMALGADLDDPALAYRSPISQLIVGNLLKIRDGSHGDAIPVGNITVSQAVETVWLYLFATVLAPAQFLVRTTPQLGSPLAGTQLDALSGFLTYNALLQIAVQGTTLGLRRLYQATSDALITQCVARVTDAQRESAGAPSDTVRFDIPIAPIITDIAEELALADSDGCTPIGDLTLERIVTRTSDHAQRAAPHSAAAIQVETHRILAAMRGTHIPHNLIPADPADFSEAESWASLLGGFIPYLGGAPLDIVLGLNHNLRQGDDPLASVPITDLTVTKSLTAAYYSYHLALHLFTEVGRLLEPEIIGERPFSPITVLSTIGALPLTYGLVTYHHVVRSMCLAEDDQTGTGRGAEANRDAESLPETARPTPGR